MPFLAPVFIAAGMTATAAAVAASAVQVVASIGLSFAARKLAAKKAKKAAAADRGSRVSLKIDTNPSRQVVIGEVATGGSLAYWQLSGANNDVLHMVIALADHECTSLQSLLVNGKPQSWNSSTGEVGTYGSSLVVRFYSGAAGQTADTELVSTSGGRWTANEKGTGLCYAVARMTYNETLFPEGIPEIAFIVRGAKLFDPRTSTTVYSDNPAVALYNVLMGIKPGGEPLLGMNVPASAIRLSEAQAAANACDELMPLSAGGTEKRYRCGTVFATAETNRDAIETLLASMAGELIESAGIYRMFAGVAQASVATLTDDDMITTEPFVVRPKRPRNELVNAVLGSYTDPSRGYTENPCPPRTSSTDEALDGNIRLSKSIDLVAVTSRVQAQRILEVERKRARRMETAAFRVRARWFVLEPGDWVTINSTRRGYVGKTFEVVNVSGNVDLGADIALREIDDQVDDWTTALEIADSQVIDLASAGPSLNSVSGVSLLAVTLTAGGTVQRPGLQMSWTPIADETVVQLQIEFRKVGDTIALTTNPVQDPSAGTYTWVTGVQSGVTYEARVRPVTRPARGVSWSAWVSADTSSAPQVVASAANLEGGITPEMLDAQSRFELSLTTAADSVLGSVSQQIADLVAQAESAHTATINALLDANESKAAIRTEQRIRSESDLALAEQITTISAQISNDILAAIQEEQVARATADSALASSVTTAFSRLNDNEASVTVLTQSLNGIEGKFGVAVNANGQVLGLVQLDGSAEAGSTFTVVADRFVVAQPGVAGGAPVPVFAIQTVNGTPRLALRGDVVADGAISARHINVASLDAITANVGVLTAGLIRDAANSYRFSLPDGKLFRTDNTMIVDLKNKIFQIDF